jgi:catechol 2,3-dioxygenase-like lactoylglutathione lyase family enzyme
MPTSIAFYRDKLGFEIISTSPALGGKDRFHWVWLRLGNTTEIMLNSAYEFDEERPVPPDPARVSSHQDICLYIGCPDVDAAYGELQAKGVEAREPKVAPYGMKQMYVRDPDGFGLCFQWSANS